MPVLRQMLALLAFFVGLTGTLLFFAFVNCIGLAPPREADDGPLPWLINAGLLMLFGLQHSGMARGSVKRVIAWWIPESLIRSLYVAMSGVALFGVVALWQPLPGKPLWDGPIWIAAISVLGWCVVVVCSTCFSFADFFGFTPAATDKLEVRGPLHITGPYRFVRHPLMLAFLIAIWGQPVMPIELLMLNVGLTVYILIAIRLEERDLVRDFGEEYVKYRREVPMLIPFLFI